MQSAGIGFLNQFIPFRNVELVEGTAIAEISIIWCIVLSFSRHAHCTVHQTFKFAVCWWELWFIVPEVCRYSLLFWLPGNFNRPLQTIQFRISFSWKSMPLIQKSWKECWVLMVICGWVPGGLLKCQVVTWHHPHVGTLLQRWHCRHDILVSHRLMMLHGSQAWTLSLRFCSRKWENWQISSMPSSTNANISATKNFLSECTCFVLPHQRSNLHINDTHTVLSLRVSPYHFPRYFLHTQCSLFAR